jgi:hypothetical protein
MNNTTLTHTLIHDKLDKAIKDYENWEQIELSSEQKKSLHESINNKLDNFNESEKINRILYLTVKEYIEN